MRRADRLFDIIEFLRRHKRVVTTAELAGALEVSIRTIYRDIADLQASRVPIEGEAGLGYMLRSGYELPPLMFTEDEIEALVFGARMVRTWGDAAFTQAADAAVDKIRAVLPARLNEVIEASRMTVARSRTRDKANFNAHLTPIRRAIRDRRRLTFDYAALGRAHDAHRAPPGPRLFRTFLDARKLVRASPRLPHFPHRTDRGARRDGRGLPRRARQDDGRLPRPSAGDAGGRRESAVAAVSSAEKKKAGLEAGLRSLRVASAYSAAPESL